MNYNTFRDFIYGKFSNINKEGALIRDLSPLEELLPRGKEYTEQECIEYLYENFEEVKQAIRGLLYHDAYKQGVFDAQMRYLHGDVMCECERDKGYNYCPNCGRGLKQMKEVDLFVAIRRKKENRDLKERTIRHIIRDYNKDINIIKSIIRQQKDEAIWRI